MEIGVIGTNEFVIALCKHWIGKGHKILFADLHLYSNGYALAENLGPQVTFSLPAKMARQAEIIVLGVQPQNLHAAVESLGSVKQKIIIDLITEEKTDGDEPSLSFNSSFEEIQKLLPEAKVVKITPDYPHHLLHSNFSKQDTLYSYSNDQLAQRMVRLFIDGTGYKMVDLQNVRVVK